MVTKQCKLERPIPSLFQSVVQVSLSHSQRAPTTIAPIIFIIVIVFVIGITVSCVNLTDSALLSFQVFVVISRTEFFVIGQQFK